MTWFSTFARLFRRSPPPLPARVYATIAASPRPVAIEGRDALSIGALRSAGLVEILDVRPTHDAADKRHNGSTYTVRAVSK